MFSTITKRTCDIFLAAVCSLVFAIPMLVIAAAVKLTSRGPCWYWSQRVGCRNELFWMPKFRSMRTETPEVATHLLADSRQWMTPIGRLLRKTSLDELPQLFCILRGQMSFVGPRPALHNQDDLVAARTANNIHLLKPGLTGWAQVNGRDELSIPEKVAYDREYLQRCSFWFDVYILWRTFLGVLKSDGVCQTGDQLATRTNRNESSTRRAA